MMRSVMPMWAAKLGYIVMSGLFCVMGGAMLTAQRELAAWYGPLLGVLMILFGCVKLIGYFSRDLFRLAFQYDLAFGLLLMVLGAVTLCHSHDVLRFLTVMMGIPVLTDGLFKVQIALDSRRFGIRRWWLIGGLAVLTCAVGGAVVFRPAAGVTALAGMSLLLDGVLNLCVALCTVKIVPYQQPDVTPSSYKL